MRQTLDVAPGGAARLRDWFSRARRLIGGLLQRLKKTPKTHKGAMRKAGARLSAA